MVACADSRGARQVRCCFEFETKVSAVVFLTLRRRQKSGLRRTDQVAISIARSVSQHLFMKTKQRTSIHFGLLRIPLSIFLIAVGCGLFAASQRQPQYTITDLPSLGGTNGFATGANSRGQIVGWAENSVHDPTCVPPQQLQFRPVVYGPNANQISELPLPGGDTSGAATGINEQGQAVGISGICDQAVGRYTAKHALLWDKNGKIVDLGNLGAPFWNTPTNINQRGDVVGFAGAPNDPDGNFLQAFIWTPERGIQPLGFLPGDVHSEAYGINERRQVVGLSCDANGNCRAFIWENGVMRDLNDFKPASYNARLEQARDVNEASEIAGRSLDSTGVRRAFLATPH